MHMIRTAEALSRLIATHPDATLRQLLALQAEQLADYDMEELAVALVVEPTDTLDALDSALGRPLVSCGLFMHPAEIIDRHAGWWSFTFILSDWGEGLILFVPDEADAALLAACEAEGDR